MNGNKTNQTYTIALDVMGGDHGLTSTIPGANLALKSAKKDGHSLHFLLFGDQAQITPILDGYPNLKAVSEICHTDKIIRGEDRPSDALRKGKGTSLRLAIEAVQEGRAQAIVSAGNTGALMATAKMVLKTVTGIHRPAIASVFPGVKEDTIMLDLGANMLVDAQNLVQFAVMGAVFASAHKGIARPRVGLLNVGTEDTKGPDHVRAAASLLSEIRFPGEYAGFVEGTDLLRSRVDAVVSDGYAGNIALKSVEGTFVFSKLCFSNAMKSDPLAIIGALLAGFALKRLKRRIDPRLYNGGVFLGLNGICIKSHGGGDDVAFSSAVTMARNLIVHGSVERIKSDIEKLMEQETLLS
jgi:glycerol-3-phosphate acyltransferase PlsX